MVVSLLTYLLISNALTLRKDKSVLFSRITLISLLLSTILAFNNIFVMSLDKGVGLYGGLFHITSFTHSFNIFIFIITAIILVLTSFFSTDYVPNTKGDFSSSIVKQMNLYLSFYSNKSNRRSEQFKILEYSLIIVFVIAGAVFLMSASDLISIFLSIELQSYGLYIISTLYRDSEQATSGGLTYFLLGGLSSCFILLGSGLLYVNSGTTNMDGIYLISGVSEILPDMGISSSTLLSWYSPYYIHLSLIILSIGFLFKVSAAPFHFWSPDVYDAIPTVVTTFVAIIAKISIFIFFLELVYFTEKSLFVFSWTNCLLISSLLSLIIGSVLGLSQFRIKRLYAYSTINHVGFILLALSINSIESIQAYIFYIITYTISNLNAFVVLVVVGYSFYNHIHKDNKFKNVLIDKKNSPIQLISQLRGYFYVNPYLALSLCITLFSFVGVPPLIGFFAKQMVLSAALDNGYIFMSLIAILTSVIGAVYYLNIIRQIFFYKSDYVISPNLTNDHKFNLNIHLSSVICGIISILTLLLMLFIYTPNEWFSVANILTLLLFKP